MIIKYRIYAEYCQGNNGKLAGHKDIEKPNQAVCSFGYDLLGLHAKLSGSIFSHHTKLFEARTQAQYNWKENEKGCAYGESDYAQPFIYPEVSYNVRSILDECGILRALILRNLQYIHRLFQ